MKRKKRSLEQIIAKRREVDALPGGGATIGRVCQQLQIREQTLHRWRQALDAEAGATLGERRNVRSQEAGFVLRLSEAPDRPDDAEACFEATVALPFPR